jgi:hypothetical protein
VRIPIKATAREPITQAGYISATSAIHAQAHLRSAAGPYNWVNLRSCCTIQPCPVWHQQATITHGVRYCRMRQGATWYVRFRGSGCLA